MFRDVKLILVALFLAGGLTLLSAQDAANTVDATGLKQGFWRKSYPNGKVRYEGNFKNDQPAGVFRYYLESGVLKMICFYYDNGQKSRAKGFNEKGSIISDGNYLKKEKDSTWTYYDEEKHIISRENFKAGVKQGTWYTYYPDGSVAEEFSYLNDKKNGVWKQNFEDGKPSLTAFYKNGVLNGKMTYYFANGTAKLTGNYVNGIREGTWFTFSENGNLTDTEVFKNGVSNKPPVLKKEEKPIKEDNELVAPKYE